MPRVFGLLFVLALLSACAAELVSLQGAKQVKIITQGHSVPLAVAFSSQQEENSAEVFVAAEGYELDNVSSRLRDGVVEIYIDLAGYGSGSGSSSSDASETLSSTGSRLSIALPSVTLLLCGATLAGFSYRRSAAVMVILCVGVLCAQSLKIQNERITVILPEANTVDSLDVVSSGLVLVSPLLHSRCGSGRSDSKLNSCHRSLCSIEDEDCLSSKAFKVGALLPYSSPAFQGFKAALEIAANNFGLHLPMVQVVLASTAGGNASPEQSAQRLYDLGCRHFIGPIYSSEVVAAHEWSKTVKEKVTFLSPAASSTRLSAFENVQSIYTNNQQFGTAYCNFLSQQFGNVGYEVTVHAIVQETEYTQNLFEIMQEECRFNRVKLELLSTYKDLKSASDAEQVAQDLSQISTGDARMAAVMHFGFEQLRFILEAMSQRQSMPSMWMFSSDAGFDENALESSASRLMASQISLSGMNFIGYNTDSSSSTRKSALKGILQRAGQVDLTSTFVHDAAMLMYLTLEKMGPVADQIDLFPSFVEQTARTTNGATGFLALSADGFRTQGDYLTAYATNATALINLRWTASFFVRHQPSQSANFLTDQVYFDRVKYYSYQTSLMSCPSHFLVVNTRDYLGRPVLVKIFSQDLGDAELLIPFFDEVVMNIYCESGELGIIVCPQGSRHEFAGCNKATEFPEARKGARELDKPFTQIDPSLFKSDAVIMTKSDNMFTSYDGAKGTTLGQLDINIKPMDFSALFP